MAAIIHQGLLRTKISSLFPGEEIYDNVKKEINIKYPTHQYLELDIWLPKINLGLEFQDEYHYIPIWYSNSPVQKIQHYDNIKKMLVHENKIDLIVVPCWWDGLSSSLAATINFQRPDLLYQNSGDPIPLNPPFHFFDEHAIVPGVGEMMAASFPKNISSFSSLSSFVDSTWWVGEKYDGIRCCWNPYSYKLYSRTGKELSFPLLFCHFPKIFIDGEIWFGRGNFSVSYNLLNNPSEFYNWDIIRVVSFDIPSYNVQNWPFEMRYEYLLKSLSSTHLFNEIASRILCNKNKIGEIIQTIIEDNGEGAILRKVGSIYDCGKSHNLVKLKAYSGDKEAIVVGTQNNSVKLKLPSGVVFEVPNYNVQIRTPEIGEIVTFAYEGHARRETPVNPVLIRIRTDLDWHDVIRNSVRDRFFNESSDVSNFTTKPPRYWNNKRMRNFLEKFAKMKNMDPLVPQTWYNISAREINRTKGGKTILQKFKGYFSALSHLFPDIAFERALGQIWKFAEYRRRFFERYAKKNNFDPLLPENWYTVKMTDLLAIKGATRAMKYHENNIRKALVDLFPEISFANEKLLQGPKVTKVRWQPLARMLQKAKNK